MSYEKQIWRDQESGGTPLVATRMNHMEEGITAANDAWDSISQYKTTEVNTGKTWINGKPIYRKVFNVGGVYANTQPKLVVHGISPITAILSVSGCADGHLSMPLVFTDSDMHANWGIGLSADATHIKVYTGVLVGLTNAVVVMEYTR